VTDAPAGLEFQVLAAERMALPAVEMRERHAVRATDPGVEVVHGREIAVRRQPLGQGAGVDERAVDALRRRAKHAMQPDGVAAHGAGAPSST